MLLQIINEKKIDQLDECALLCCGCFVRCFFLLCNAGGSILLMLNHIFRAFTSIALLLYH